MPPSPLGAELGYGTKVSKGLLRGGWSGQSPGGETGGLWSMGEAVGKSLLGGVGTLDPGEGAGRRTSKW